MFRLEYGGRIIYEQDNTAYLTTDVELVQELNVADELKFTLHPGHAYLNKIDLMNKGREIVLYKDGSPLFRGRVTDVKQDFNGSETYTCEGDLGYLNDATVPAYETGVNNCPSKVNDFFAWLITYYNAIARDGEKFLIGVNQGSLLDTNNYIYRKSENGGESVWSEVVELINSVGGFVRTRTENNLRYIDLIADTGKVNAQKIEFGKNLLDFTREKTGTEIFTRLIPTGGIPEGAKAAVTISSVSNGYIADGFYKSGNYIDATNLQKKYGIIVKNQTFNDCLTAQGLANSALKALQAVEIGDSLEFTAFDMSLIDPNFKSIEIGEYIRATSKPHNFDQFFLCTKREYKPDDAGNETFKLGSEYSTLSKKMASTMQSLTDNINHVYEAVNTGALNGEDATTLRIVSSQGSVFKNDGVSTVLQVVIYKGDKRIATKADLVKSYGSDAYLQWGVKAPNGDIYNDIDKTDSRITNDGFFLTISPSDVDSKAVFTCSLMV